MTMCTDWDFVNVRDFEYLNNLWNNTYSKINEGMLSDEIIALGETLITELDLPIAATPLNAQQSKFFKTIYQNPMRMSNKFMEKE